MKTNQPALKGYIVNQNRRAALLRARASRKAILLGMPSVLLPLARFPRGQLRELRIQTRPQRLSGSLGGLACCSPPSRPPGRPIAFELRTARARVQTFRQAHTDRLRHRLYASADTHQLYATSGGAQAPHYKKKAAASARAQRAAAAAQEDGLARRHAPARVRPQHRKTAAADQSALVQTSVPRLQKWRGRGRPRRRPRH